MNKPNLKGNFGNPRFEYPYTQCYTCKYLERCVPYGDNKDRPCDSDKSLLRLISNEKK